jgi:hypothetical protein
MSINASLVHGEVSRPRNTITFLVSATLICVQQPRPPVMLSKVLRLSFHVVVAPERRTVAFFDFGSSRMAGIHSPMSVVDVSVNFSSPVPLRMTMSEQDSRLTTSSPVQLSVHQEHIRQADRQKGPPSAMSAWCRQDGQTMAKACSCNTRHIGERNERRRVLLERAAPYRDLARIPLPAVEVCAAQIVHRVNPGTAELARGSTVSIRLGTHARSASRGTISGSLGG